MEIKLPSIKIGNLIFSSRIENEMTQEQLSYGICSIPYLSKLENNKIEASEDILIHLLQRLDIKFEEINDGYYDLVKFLEQWYEAIINKDTNLVAFYKKEIQTFQTKNLPPELSHYVQLIKIRCALFDKEMDIAFKLISKLEKTKKNMSKQVLNYFIYFQGIFSCMEFDYYKGKTLFLEAEQSFLSDSIKNVPELQFHLAFAFSQLHDISMSIYYAENAKQLFTQQLKYNKIIECDLIIGINLTRQARYVEAAQKFRTIISMCKLNKHDQLRAKGLHNLAYLESQKQNHKVAIKLYKEALLLKEKNENSYLVTLFHLSEEYRKVKEFDNVKNISDEIINLQTEYSLSQEYYYKAIVMKLEISGDSENLLVFLEEEVIPYFESKNDFTSLSKLLFTAAHTFEKDRKYKKSSEYYKKAYHLLTTKKEVF